jgi:hypothetical protein
MIRAYQMAAAVVFTVVVSSWATASDYSNLVQSHGPVAYWRLGELSGTTAADTTGAHNGTYQTTYTLGGTAAIVDDTDKSVTFGGGANDRVHVNAFGISGTGITILAWFKANGFGDDRFVAKATGTNLATAYWSLGTDSSNRLKAQIMIGGTAQELQPSVNLQQDVWYFAAVTYNGSTMRVYLDGVEVGSGSYSGAVTADSTVAVGLGNLPSGAGNRAFNGALDELAVFDKELTAAQIWTLFTTAGGGLRGRWKLIETSGTTAADTSAQQNNGTYTNGVVLASSGPYAGPGDKAANFDGADDHVAIPNQALYDLTGPIAVAAWIKVDVFDDVDQAILTKGKNAWRLQRDGSNNGVVFTCDNLSTESIATTVSFNDGQWHHVVGVYTGSQLQIYVDGVLNNSVSSTGNIRSNNRNVQIGRNSQNPSAEFDGSIHDARIYSRSLSAAEVARLYGLIGDWKLNQTSGTTATDTTPFGRNGTLTGSANWSTDCGGTGVFDFDGSAHVFTIANATDFQPTTMLAAAAWIKGDAWGSGSSANAILRKGDTNPNNYALQVADGRVELLLDGNDSAGIRGNTVLATGQWYHVAATWDGSTVKIYVNGQLDNGSGTARTGTIGADTRPLYLGGRAGADYFNGMIRDIRFYNRPFTSAELVKMAGLAGHWKFAEGSGTSAADSSGLANTATLSGGATWTTDCVGNNNALLTNGTGGIAATGTSFTPPDVGTVTFWMRSSGTPAGTVSIAGLSDNWEVCQTNTGIVVFDLCGNGGADFRTTTPLTDVNRWYHVAATFDSSNDSYAVYVDGQLEKSGTNSNAMAQQLAGLLSFGTRTGSAAYWQGALRDFRVYSRKLCPTEIAELYGLVLHWKLDETSGTAAADSSGFGRTGTVVGTPTWATGALNNAIQLNGANRVEVTSLLGSPKNVTLAAWANLTGADSGGAEIVSIADYFAIRLNEGSISRAFFYNGSTWPSCSVSQTYANAGWHHFAAVYNDDQNNCKLYVDGTEVASVATTVTIPYTGLGTKVVVGAHGNGSTTYDFSGKIDDVRVYSRALCPLEIDALYDSGSPFQGVKIIKWVEIQ